LVWAAADFPIFGTIELMKWNISTLEELHTVAEDIYKTLEKDKEHATLLTLKGDLGAGKTAFTKELAKILGVETHVTSPTFVLAKEYNLKDQAFSKLIHIDAYRLEGEETLETVGFDELLKDENVDRRNSFLWSKPTFWRLSDCSFNVIKSNRCS